MREGESKEDVVEQAPSDWASLDPICTRQITKLIMQIGNKALFLNQQVIYF